MPGLSDRTMLMSARRRKPAMGLIEKWRGNDYLNAERLKRSRIGAAKILAKAKDLGLKITTDDTWYEDYWDDGDYWGKVDKCYYVGDLWINCVPIREYDRGSSTVVNYGYNGDEDGWYLDGTGNVDTLAYWPKNPWSIEMVAEEFPHILKCDRREFAELLNTDEAEFYCKRYEYCQELRWFMLLDPEGEELEAMSDMTEEDAAWNFSYAIDDYEASLMREAEEMFAEEWCSEIEAVELAMGQVGGR